MLQSSRFITGGFKSTCFEFEWVVERVDECSKRKRIFFERSVNRDFSRKKRGEMCYEWQIKNKFLIQSE